jgi:hypothetical protein
MDKPAKYLKDFETFSPAQQQRHLAIALGFLLKIIEEQEAAALPATDEGTIDAEYTIGESKP